MSVDLPSLLDRVCDQDRADTSTPFGVIYMGQRLDAATDGSIALIVESSDHDRREPVSGAIEGLINKIPLPPFTACSMQDLRAWAGDDDGMCTVCGGAGHMNRIDCETCDGSGYVECDLGHEHDCRNCSGDGYTADKCAACDGRRGRKILGGLIDGRYINRCLIASVIHDLPGSFVKIASTREAVAINGVGWMLLISPVAGTAPLNTPEFTAHND